MNYEICLATDVGCLRSNNEDGFYINHIGCYDTNECFIYEKNKTPILAFAADGVGGSAAGEEATRLCIETALFESMPHNDTELIELIEKMNKLIKKQRESIDTACTIAGVLLKEDNVLCFNIGDSRVYSLQHGFLNQHSVDDTISGISGEIVETKEPLLQYLGKDNIIPHITEIGKCSTIFICTDGLTDMVTLDEIEKIFQENTDIKHIASELINVSKINGGQDNITVIIIKPEKEEM